MSSSDDQLPDAETELYQLVLVQSSSLLCFFLCIFYCLHTAKVFESKHETRWYKGPKSMLLAFAGWIVACLSSLVRFIFIVDMFIEYSGDDYQHDCPNGLNCISCSMSSVFIDFAYAIKLAIDYCIMIQILDETLIMPSLKYSSTVIKTLRIVLVIPLIVGVIGWQFCGDNQIFDAHKLGMKLCFRKVNQQTQHEADIVRLGSGVHMGLFTIIIWSLFLVKLHQLYKSIQQEVRPNRDTLSFTWSRSHTMSASSFSSKVMRTISRFQSQLTTQDIALTAIASTMARHTVLVSTYFIVLLTIGTIPGLFFKDRPVIIATSLVTLIHATIIFFMFAGGTSTYHFCCYVPHHLCLICTNLQNHALHQNKIDVDPEQSVGSTSMAVRRTSISSSASGKLPQRVRQNLEILPTLEQ